MVRVTRSVFLITTYSSFSFAFVTGASLPALSNFTLTILILLAAEAGAASAVVPATRPTVVSRAREMLVIRMSGTLREHRDPCAVNRPHLFGLDRGPLGHAELASPPPRPAAMVGFCV